MRPASIHPGIVEETADPAGSRRRFRKGFAWSFGVHAVALAGLGLLSLLTVERVPPPPLTIRFFALPPPAPRLVPPREEEPPKQPPRRAPAHPALMTPLRLPPPEPSPAARPEPLPQHVEPQALPIQVNDAAPTIAVHDAAPSVASAPALAPIGSPTRPRMGNGAEPEVALLVPGPARPHDPGGALAGRGLPGEPAGEPSGGIRRGGAGGPDAGALPMAREQANAFAGLASFLGRKYGVHLMEASRLGSRTSDGARYALALPALSEAYHGVTVRGRVTAPAGDEVESLQVDKESIAIRYRDGTVHVLAPTDDGLVALYVSAAGAESRSKVDEAERALAVLRRLGRAGGGR